MQEKIFLEEMNQEINEQNKKINLFKNKFEKEIENIGFILKGIEDNSLGGLGPNNDNLNIVNDKEILKFFVFSRYSTFLSSNYKTLKSINLLLIVDLPYGDIMALLRRFTETLYFFIFFVFVYKNYNKFEIIKKEQIKAWMNLKDKKLLRFCFVKDFFIDNKILEEILKLLNIDDEFLKNKRNRLNDFIHYNGYIYLNYYESDFEKKYEFLVEVLNEVKLYIKIFILFCTTKCEHFCTSSDYVDCLEMGIEPIEGSQYMMMPVLNDYIIKNFTVEEIDYIRNHSNLKFDNEVG